MFDFIFRKNVDVDVVILVQPGRTIVVPTPADTIHTVLFNPALTSNNNSPNTNPGVGDRPIWTN